MAMPIEAKIIGHVVLTSLTHCPNSSESINSSPTDAKKLNPSAGTHILPATNEKDI